MEVPNAPSGVGVDSNSESSETSGVKLRHRKAMTVKNLAAYFNVTMTQYPYTLGKMALMGT